MTAAREILFARHGNTFGPGDRVVWVGRGTDLPLVERGREQAREVAAALVRADLAPTAVLSGTLARTREFADIVRTSFGLPVAETDARLNEIDYGAWEGRTSEEIVAASAFGAAAIDDWQKADRWPEDAGWRSTRAEIVQDLASVLREVVDGRGGRRPLLVSSNGVLRFAAEVLGIEGERSPRQLKTGHLGLAVRDTPDGPWRLRFWGTAPADITRG